MGGYLLTLLGDSVCSQRRHLGDQQGGICAVPFNLDQDGSYSKDKVRSAVVMSNA